MDNKERLEKLRKAAEQDEGATQAEIGAFNIDDFIGDTDELRVCVVPKIGKVQYKLLTYDETRKLNKQFEKKKVKDQEERGLYVIAAMMRKADGKTTAKKLHNLPGGVANKLLTRLSTESGFL